MQACPIIFNILALFSRSEIRGREENAEEEYENIGRGDGSMYISAN